MLHAQRGHCEIEQHAHQGKKESGSECLVEFLLACVPACLQVPPSNMATHTLQALPTNVVVLQLVAGPASVHQRGGLLVWLALGEAPGPQLLPMNQSDSIPMPIPCQV